VLGETYASDIDRFSVQVFTGLLLLSDSLLAVSLLTPLTPAVALLAFVAAPAVLLVIPATRHQLAPLAKAAQHPRFIIAAAILLAAAGWNGTGMVELADTGVYHYQMVRWLHDAGTVPGMALFFAGLGFSSSWFTIPAALEFGPMRYRTGAVIGELLLLLAILHFTVALARVLGRRTTASDLFLVGAYPLAFWNCLLARYQLSPSPNFAVWIYTVFLGWLVLRAERPSLWIVTVAGGTLAVKVVAGLLAPAALLHYGRQAGRWRGAAAALLVSALAAAPFLTANLVSSGCPVFPAPVLCTASSSSAGASEAAQVLQLVRAWTRWRGAPPASGSKTNTAWMARWSAEPSNLALVLLCVVCGTGILWRKAWRTAPNLFWVLGMAIAGCLTLGVLSPDPRYALGYIALFPGLLAASFAGSGLPATEPRGARWLSVLLLAAAGVLLLDSGLRDWTYRLRTGGAPISVAERLLLPPLIQRRGMDAAVTGRQNDFVYFRPQHGDLCWGAPLPCTPLTPPANLRLCHPQRGLRGGFCQSP
jgi:hypothetical protein